MFRRVRATRPWKAFSTLALVAVCTWAAVEWLNWPSVAELVSQNPRDTAFMARHSARRAERPDLPPVRWQWVEWSAISVHLKRAAVCAEDMEFFWHGGFSTSEIRAAIRKAIAEREAPRGASTITQQVAKNLWLSPSRSPLRKFKEVVLTRQLERHLDKRRILEIYLNVAELGPGLFGAEAAARHYFGKSAAALSEREAAMLAASLPRPSTWHPGVTSSAYSGYVSVVQRRMADADFLWRYVQ